MGMSEFYGSADEGEAVATIHRALELGVTFLDTADMYGVGANEELVGRAIRDRRDKVVLATKFGIVPYSPLGRGFLTGQIRSPEDLAPDDWRRNMPRFQGENFQRNLDLVAEISRMAEEKGCTPAQLALAWVLAQGS